MKRSKSGIDGNILSVDEIKKEYPDSGTEIPVSVHNDMLSDLSVGTRHGEPHVDRNPISKNCGTDLSVNTTSQVGVVHLHQSHRNAGCSNTPFETFSFFKILKYPKSDEIYECLHCDKKFATREGVIAHQITHTTDSASAVNYHDMERSISEINKSVHSRESGIAIETGIDADELKDVVPSTELDHSVDAYSVEAGTNVLGDVNSDLDRCPSPVHSECSSNVACSEGSPEYSAIDTSEKLDASAECEMKFPDIVSLLYSQEFVRAISEKIYPCSACGMEFTRKGLL